MNKINYIDFLDKKFGNLTFCKFEYKDKWSNPWCLFLCNCGNKKILNLNSVKYGFTKSCGCILNKNHTNKRYGILIGIKYSKTKNHKKYWIFKCDCGNYMEAQPYSVISGNTKSCGCLTKKYQTKERAFGETSCKRTYNMYKQSAKKRNIVFNLTFEYFKKLSQLNCYYCDSRPSNITKNYNNQGNYTYNGIDRVRNSIGYIITNCVTCCKKCNVAKNNMSLNEFLTLVIKIYKKRIKSIDISILNKIE